MAYKKPGPGFAEILLAAAQTLSATIRQAQASRTGQTSIPLGGSPAVETPEVPHLPERPEELFAKGFSSFEVTWSVVVTTTKRRFIKPRIDKVEHAGTSWE
jgi:hypothetical protein